ncbi:PREDICTED: uncharacterized protein LOC106149638 [Chinchilla lanigera]|uniref:uncharacterized protein LOC106149638 n=1 Tax=Chinchilla lanigera TaxID=34839 RepID=UPI0006977671|nr:PREDICTED: uncharacterized protein LOC106149638 [Chinchilla lanigera]
MAGGPGALTGPTCSRGRRSVVGSLRGGLGYIRRVCMRVHVRDAGVGTRLRAPECRGSENVSVCAPGRSSESKWAIVPLPREQQRILGEKPQVLAALDPAEPLTSWTRSRLSRSAQAPCFPLAAPSATRLYKLAGRGWFPNAPSSVCPPPHEAEAVPEGSDTRALPAPLPQTSGSCSALIPQGPLGQVKIKSLPAVLKLAGPARPLESSCEGLPRFPAVLALVWGGRGADFFSAHGVKEICKHGCQRGVSFVSRSLQGCVIYLFAKQSDITGQPPSPLRSQPAPSGTPGPPSLCPQSTHEMEASQHNTRTKGHTAGDPEGPSHAGLAGAPPTRFGQRGSHSTALSPAAPWGPALSPGRLSEECSGCSPAHCL